MVYFDLTRVNVLKVFLRLIKNKSPMLSFSSWQLFDLVFFKKNTSDANFKTFEVVKNPFYVERGRRHSYCRKFQWRHLLPASAPLHLSKRTYYSVLETAIRLSIYLITVQVIIMNPLSINKRQTKESCVLSTGKISCQTKMAFSKKEKKNAECGKF